ncbi:MAG TPA: methyltransferase domain-containing protein [Acidimicrobiales bacterium]|nr:methyltransferase domain-containing protein [Acidimicrobiales bacterium]
MSWETWEWDETLFEGCAPYYEQGRPPYAPGLADALRGALALDGHGRLLDVGCGPGKVALLLAHLFDEVVGLDPDSGMIAEAERLATERGVTNARFVLERAEALPAGLGTFRVATFAASFHWLDRPKVAQAVRGMLEPGGAAVQIGTPAYRSPVDDSVEVLRVRYLGLDKRAGRSIRNTSPSGEDEVFRSAGFHPMQVVTVPDGRALDRSVDDLIAQHLSSSSTAPHLLGDRLDDFVRDVRAALFEVNSSGRFAVTLPANELRIWRPR